MFRYHLRIIVWNTAEVPPADLSITGEEMSDIYVKGESHYFVILKRGEAVCKILGGELE